MSLIHDWLAEHDRSIAERQREACAARVESRDILREYAESACRATPLVTK